MLNVVSQSSLTLTGSEQTVNAAQTEARTYALLLDLNAVVDGDVVELYVYEKVASAGSARLIDKFSWANSQSGKPHKMIGPYPSPYSIEFKLKQPTGTGRSVPYCLMYL